MIALLLELGFLCALFFSVVSTGSPSSQTVALFAGAAVANVILVCIVGLSLDRGVRQKLHDLLLQVKPSVSALEEERTGGEIERLGEVLEEMSTSLRLSKRTVQSLRDDLKKERSILEGAADVICSLDLDFRFQRISQAAQRVFLYAPEELENRWLIEFLHRDDVPDTVRNLKSAVEQNELPTFENRFIRKDGVMIQVLWSTYWSEDDEALICVAHEITERKNAEDMLRLNEARIRFIVECVPVGIVIVRTDGSIETVNPAFEDMLGISFEELANQDFLDYFVESKSRSQPAIKDLLGKHSSRMQTRRRSSELMPVDVNLSEIEVLEGKRYLAVVIDTTERYQIEKMKREFMALITHELRSPLTSLQGFLSMLKGGVYGAIPEVAQNKIVPANRSIDRLMTLVNDILDLEKMESGMFEFRFSKVSMRDVIERSIESISEMAATKNVSIERNLIDAIVNADSDRLVQVVVNLLANAIKFSPEGTSIEVSSRTAAGGIEVRIKDSGPGIPAEFKELIFERFSQIPGIESGFKSTGLGLPISKAIVAQHAGTIGVDSEPGQGSSFWFWLST